MNLWTCSGTKLMKFPAPLSAITAARHNSWSAIMTSPSCPYRGDTKRAKVGGK